MKDNNEVSNGTVIAANLWTDPTTEKCIMEPEVCALAAKKFDDLLDIAEMAWGIIANASGGDWNKEPESWHEAAAKWRDDYHAFAKAHCLKVA